MALSLLLMARVTHTHLSLMECSLLLQTPKHMEIVRTVMAGIQVGHHMGLIQNSFSQLTHM